MCELLTLEDIMELDSMLLKYIKIKFCSNDSLLKAAICKNWPTAAFILKTDRGQYITRETVAVTG